MPARDVGKRVAQRGGEFERRVEAIGGMVRERAGERSAQRGQIAAREIGQRVGSL